MFAGTGGLGAAAREPGTCSVCLVELSAGKESTVRGWGRHGSSALSLHRATAKEGQATGMARNGCLTHAGSWHRAQPHTAPLSPLYSVATTENTQSSAIHETPVPSKKSVCGAEAQGGHSWPVPCMGCDLGSCLLAAEIPRDTQGDPQPLPAQGPPQGPPHKQRASGHYLSCPWLPQV